MQRTGIIDLPLHGGYAPSWLVTRMKLLCKAILEVINLEFGEKEILVRLANPFWFQSLACTLAYDWHSSGTTTVVCGVLKTVLNELDLNIKGAGGKGKAGVKTPQELHNIGKLFKFNLEEVNKLVYASKMAAKVDSAAIQDGYSIYHHSMFICEDGTWIVIQQGMNPRTGYARRYHWGNKITSFVDTPHEGIVGNYVHTNVLDMTAKESKGSRKACVDLLRESPKKIAKLYYSIRPKGQASLFRWINKDLHSLEVDITKLPKRINWDIIKEIYEFSPTNYEQILSFKGVGPATIRGLALVSELIYGEVASWKDPIKYSFSFGGKDGVPYPVDRKTMDSAINIIEEGISRAKIGDYEKIRALRRLQTFVKGLGINETH
jgi:hypothetical protein